MDAIKRLLSLSFIPSGWLTLVSGWLLVLAALLCWSDTVSAVFPWINCSLVAATAGGTGLIGIRRAIAAAKK